MSHFGSMGDRRLANYNINISIHFQNDNKRRNPIPKGYFTPASLSFLIFSSGLELTRSTNGGTNTSPT